MSLIRNLLFLAVFGAAFAACDNDAPATADTTAEAGEASRNIVFVRADTILARYTVFADKLAALESKLAEAEAEHQERVQGLQREISRVQNRMQQGLLAPNKIAEEQERIARREQEILTRRDQIVRELQAAQIELNNELQENVDKALKAIQDERNYDYILNYGPGTGVLMANDALDITEDVLKRLNEMPVPQLDSTSVDTAAGR